MTDLKTRLAVEPTSRRPTLPFLEEVAPEHASPVLRTGAGLEAEALHASIATQRRPQQRRRDWIKMSMLVCVVLPTILTGIYYAFIAADQYSAEVRFAVRGASSKAGTELLGVFAGVAGSSGSTVTDAYIVMDYIRSREVLEKMQPLIDVRGIYSHNNADWLARFDPSEPIEEFVSYWRDMLDVGFDAASQIITVKVRAFTSEDAKRVAETIIRLSEGLINALSERARQDAVKYAEIEVQRTEERLKINRTTLRSFRDKKQEIDPVKAADAQLLQISRLEEELTSTRLQADTLRRYMSDEAPNIKFLKNKIAALQQQVSEERKKLGVGAREDQPGSTLSGLVADYEELVVEREFAEKAYVSALASLERARLEAVQQQRYLATFISPTLPEEALYPKRLTNTLLVFGAGFVLWALGVLIVYAIRDHAT